MEEKMIYKVMAQKDGYTITAQTEQLKFDDAIQAATLLISRETDLRPFVLIPVSTKKRWQEGTINFCPRCGANLKDYELDTYADFECSSCDASVKVTVMGVSDDD